MRLRGDRRLVIAALVAAIVVAGVLLLVAFRGGESSSWYGDPFDPFPDGGQRGSATEAAGNLDPSTELTRLLPFVVDDVQRFWAEEFRRSGLSYEPAQVVVFRKAVSSGCGLASSATGPFYCPLDRSVYLDLGFFRELAQRFQAPGDFAQAYVIAHEMGHHVQTLTGITGQVQRAIAEGAANPNALSVRQELQADCLAGVWSYSTYERRLLERGDLEEALRAAAAVGDDRIQKQTTGRVDPETWTHGSSEQRRTWFLKGFDSGDPNACDTFSGSV
jgi:uncharacterized protein